MASPEPIFHLLAIQGPEKMISPSQVPALAIQDVENMTSSKFLQVGAAKGGKLAGHRIHRGNISSFFPSSMRAAERRPEGGYVRLLRSGWDIEMSC